MSTTDTGPRIVRDLIRLGQLERAVSARRRQVHHDIARLYLDAPLDETQMRQLDRLEAIERAVSGERRKLHETIDDLRAQIGLPRRRDEHDHGADRLTSSAVTCAPVQGGLGGRR